MPHYAIVHAGTRVVRRATTQEPPEVAQDEIAIQTMPFDLAGGPWRLDASNNRILAALDEVRQAGMDEAWNRQQRIAKRTAIKDALQDIVGDVAMPPKLRVLARAWLEWFG
jgi:hypothetical protein